MPPLVRAIRFAVVGVWAGLLIALAYSHLPPSEHPPTTVAGAITATAEGAGADLWSGIYMNGSKIGYGHYRSTPAGGSLRIEETSLLRLTVLDREQTVQATVTADAADDLSMRRFDVALTSDLGTFAARGTVADGHLDLDVTTGGQTTTQRVPLDQPLYLPAAARARLTGTALQEGTTLTVQAFDAAAMQHEPMTMRVVGRENLTEGGVAVPTWKVRESFRGMESDVWLDDSGRTVRERGPMGLEVRRESAADAVAKGWSSAPLDLMGAVAVPVTDISAPRERDRLRLRLAGVEGVAIPSDGRQHGNGAELVIERETVRAATYQLPYDGAEWQSELQPTMFLQSDHPKVRAAARVAVGDERDPLAAAERLRHWVHDGLEKRPAATLPNALQVLETRAGDCNEHAVLYAALARAVGLPARVVAGLVYQNGAFLYHAWDEVWLGDGWLTVDAIFDQMPVDVTHIKLVEGGPETHAALAPLIGKLSIRVLPERDAG
ncbi:MAG TPA: transglutaminase-like domain-containing protein [Candidatus Dormibacteraeota bacterium]|nr:transglutaminase-like domain-containing protein [Candidatus Dormibacteraeota bacterium]